MKPLPALVVAAAVLPLEACKTYEVELAAEQERNTKLDAENKLLRERLDKMVTKTEFDKRIRKVEEEASETSSRTFNAAMASDKTILEGIARIGQAVTKKNQAVDKDITDIKEEAAKAKKWREKHDIALEERTNARTLAETKRTKIVDDKLEDLRKDVDKKVDTATERRHVTSNRRRIRANRRLIAGEDGKSGLSGRVAALEDKHKPVLELELDKLFTAYNADDMSAYLASFERIVASPKYSRKSILDKLTTYKGLNDTQRQEVMGAWYGSKLKDIFSEFYAKEKKDAAKAKEYLDSQVKELDDEFALDDGPRNNAFEVAFKTKYHRAYTEFKIQIAAARKSPKKQELKMQARESMLSAQKMLFTTFEPYVDAPRLKSLAKEARSMK